MTEHSSDRDGTRRVEVEERAGDPADASLPQPTGRLAALAARFEAWRTQARRNPVTNLVWRSAVLGIGFAIVAAGIVMLVIPGPGWAAIFLGLAILATEFVWARSVLMRAKGMALRTKERALDPASRRRNLALLVTLVAAIVTFTVLYVARYGWSAAPFLQLVDR